jgi:hypothetical protein
MAEDDDDLDLDLDKMKDLISKGRSNRTKPAFVVRDRTSSLVDGRPSSSALTRMRSASTDKAERKNFSQILANIEIIPEQINAPLAVDLGDKASAEEKINKLEKQLQKEKDDHQSVAALYEKLKLGSENSKTEINQLKEKQKTLLLAQAKLEEELEANFDLKTKLDSEVMISSQLKINFEQVNSALATANDRLSNLLIEKTVMESTIQELQTKCDNQRSVEAITSSAPFQMTVKELALAESRLQEMATARAAEKSRLAELESESVLLTKDNNELQIKHDTLRDSFLDFKSKQLALFEAQAQQLANLQLEMTDRKLTLDKANALNSRLTFKSESATKRFEAQVKQAQERYEKAAADINELKALRAEDRKVLAIKSSEVFTKIVLLRISRSRNVKLSNEAAKHNNVHNNNNNYYYYYYYNYHNNNNNNNYNINYNNYNNNYYNDYNDYNVIIIMFKINK